jgi:hypothetical protein
MRRSLCRAALPVLAITLLASLMAAGPAAQAASAPQADGVNAGQLAADAVADQVDALVQADHLQGFAGEVVNPQTRGLTVYWHGRPPVTAMALTASARASAVAVSFRPAPYSQAQLNGFRNQILDSPGIGAAGISMIIIYPQATGLSIGVAHGSAAARRLPVIARSKIPVSFFTATAVPLTYLTPVATTPARARPDATSSSVPGRWNDDPPFKGGASISSIFKLAGKDEQEWCSTGYGVHFSNAKKRFFVTTAYHCIAFRELLTQTFFISTDKKKVVGNTFSGAGNYDIATLDTRGGVKNAGGGRQIYMGSALINSSHAQTLAPVRGSSQTQVGDIVLTSGSFSGTRTKIKVKSTDAVWEAITADGAVEYRVFGVYAVQKNHSNAAGQGDSGGPVIVTVKNGISARGIISAGVSSSRTACTGVHTGEFKYRKCYWGLLYTPIGPALSELNLSLNLY